LRLYVDLKCPECGHATSMDAYYNNYDKHGLGDF
jgi:hypothetical protein